MVVIENESIDVLIQLIGGALAFLLFTVLVICGFFSRLANDLPHSARFVELGKKADKFADYSFKILLPLAILVMLILGIGRFPNPLYFWVVLTSFLGVFTIVKAINQKTELSEVVLSKNRAFNILLTILSGVALVFLWAISVIFIPAFILPQL